MYYADPNQNAGPSQIEDDPSIPFAGVAAFAGAELSLGAKQSVFLGSSLGVNAAPMSTSLGFFGRGATYLTKEAVGKVAGKGSGLYRAADSLHEGLVKTHQRFISGVTASPYDELFEKAVVSGKAGTRLQESYAAHMKKPRKGSTIAFMFADEYDGVTDVGKDSRQMWRRNAQLDRQMHKNKWFSKHSRKILKEVGEGSVAKGARRLATTASGVVSTKLASKLALKGAVATLAAPVGAALLAVDATSMIYHGGKAAAEAYGQGYQRTIGLEYGPTSPDSMAGATNRQRAMEEISKSRLNARAALGSEASILHR